MSELQPSAPITYQGFRFTFRIISHLFFRKIETTGSHLIPKTGPCIFIVGPHANQFLDGIVLFSKNPRHSYGVMASVSYNKPVIGHVGKILNAIPVVRPQDIVSKGTGTITYDPQNEPLVLRGQGTRFTQEIGERDFVFFGRSYKGHVGSVISDTELHLTHPIVVDADASVRNVAFKIAPHVDQTPVYKEVHSYLANNECITVFPEGGSHDRPEMLPLKAGFAVMALGAMAEHPGLDVKIVPVGLNYFHPDRFRSRAVVSFGQPLSIDPAEVEKFKEGGKARREAITRLMDESDEAFHNVTVNAPDYQTLMITKVARRLYQPSKYKISLPQVVQLNRHFVSAWLKLKDDPQLQALNRKIKLYSETLAFFGIRDHQVDKLTLSPMRAALLLTKRMLSLTVLAGLGAPAILSNFPLIWLTKYVSQKKQKEALAGSMVKIAGKDVLATWKVLVAAFVAPALYGLYALVYLGYLLKKRPQLSLTTKLARAGAVWAIQPIMYYILMRLGDTGLDIYRSIKPLFLAIRNPEASKIIQIMRNDLSRDITAFVKAHETLFFPEDAQKPFKSL